MLVELSAAQHQLFQRLGAFERVLLRMDLRAPSRGLMVHLVNQINHRPRNPRFETPTGSNSGGDTVVEIAVQAESG